MSFIWSRLPSWPFSTTPTTTIVKTVDEEVAEFQNIIPEPIESCSEIPVDCGNENIENNDDSDDSGESIDSVDSGESVENNELEQKPEQTPDLVEVWLLDAQRNNLKEFTDNQNQIDDEKVTDIIDFVSSDAQKEEFLKMCAPFMDFPLLYR